MISENFHDQQSRCACRASNRIYHQQKAFAKLLTLDCSVPEHENSHCYLTEPFICKTFLNKAMNLKTNASPILRACAQVSICSGVEGINSNNCTNLPEFLPPQQEDEAKDQQKCRRTDESNGSS